MHNLSLVGHDAHPLVQSCKQPGANNLSVLVQLQAPTSVRADVIATMDAS